MLDNNKLRFKCYRMQSNKNRIIVFDILKLFAIFLVIWGHVLLHLQNYQYEIWRNPLYRWICSFHMPLFMMISGFFSAKLSNSLREYLIKKFRQLILPSITFGVFFAISWHFVNGGGYWDSLIRCYWFLKSAFACSVLYYAANCFNRKAIGYLLTVIISLFFYIYQVNLMYIPYLVGVLAFTHKDILKDKALIIACITGIIFFIMYSNWSYEMADYPLLRFYQYINPVKVYHVSYPLFLFVYKVVMGLCGSLFIISIFIWIAKYIPANKTGKILGKWGTMTLGIYLWQAIILEHIMMKTIDLSSMEWNLFNYVVSPIISLSVLGVCIILTELLKSNRWTAFLFLGIGNLPR